MVEILANPTVSAVIPTYNRAHLGRCIRILPKWYSGQRANLETMVTPGKIDSDSMVEVFKNERRLKYAHTKGVSRAASS